MGEGLGAIRGRFIRSWGTNGGSKGLLCKRSGADPGGRHEKRYEHRYPINQLLTFSTLLETEEKLKNLTVSATT